MTLISGSLWRTDAYGSEVIWKSKLKKKFLFGIPKSEDVDYPDDVFIKLTLAGGGRPQVSVR